MSGEILVEFCCEVGCEMVSDIIWGILACHARLVWELWAGWVGTRNQDEMQWWRSAFGRWDGFLGAVVRCVVFARLASTIMLPILPRISCLDSTALCA